MFICGNCSFKHSKLRGWKRHETLTGHKLEGEEEGDPSNSSSSGSEIEPDELSIQLANRNELNNVEPVSPDVTQEAYSENDPGLPTSSPQVAAHYSPLQVADASQPTYPDSPESGSEDSADPWFPFRSRIHYFLIILYHGSHRKNFDQETLEMIMEITKRNPYET